MSWMSTLTTGVQGHPGLETLSQYEVKGKWKPWVFFAHVASVYLFLFVYILCICLYTCCGSVYIPCTGSLVLLCFTPPSHTEAQSVLNTPTTTLAVGVDAWKEKAWEPCLEPTFLLYCSESWVYALSPCFLCQRSRYNEWPRRFPLRGAFLLLCHQTFRQMPNDYLNQNSWHQVAST